MLGICREIGVTVIKHILMIVGLLTVTGTAAAQGLTLEDFNRRSPTTVIREALLEAGVGVEGLPVILVANDDCDLGWTDEQLQLIIWNVNMMRVLTTREDGQTLAIFDVVALSDVWMEMFQRGNRVAQMALCEPLRRASEYARSKL